MIQAEYLRFLQTLNTAAVSPEIRKLANLVLANLDGLVPLGTHQGQRIKRMVALTQAHWDTLSAVIQPLPEHVAEQTSSITQIKSLTVGPFRGFSRQEVFDLDSRLVLIYGPNGAGKSSFCEALEYGLLGNVAEAENKRFRDQREYLKNVYVKRFATPVITGLNDQGQELPVDSKEELYRFCFVEKNRIDSFSRIAAQAPAKQTELIATLFGLDSFNEFVRNFTTEIDARYIDLTGVKAAQLMQKRLSLTGYQQQLVTNNTELQTLATEEHALAKQYREGCSFNKMVIELNGDVQNAGEIRRIELEVQQPQAMKSALSVTNLNGLRQEIYNDLAALNLKNQELANAGQQVSFRSLYEAVTQVQSSSPDNCPACKTPLGQAVVNPYSYAGEELQKLQHLSLLQEASQQLELRINQSLFALTKILGTCCSRLAPNVLAHYQVAPNIQANVDWWNSLHQPMQDKSTAWQHLQVLVAQLEESDRVIDQAAQIRLSKQEELQRLREFARKITVLLTRRHTAQQALTAAQEAITNFDTENAQLIAGVEAERVLVARNQSIAASYRNFVTRLNAYKDMLPGQLVADLGEVVVMLYNSFNRNDSEGEKLARVKLPLAQNQRLEISFQRNPEQLYDALHVLSEGHIRCVGLAILLAKNLKENCPFLIFDDPVNAIDDDHRESIRRTLFEDQHFSNKQILLTCHGEEFFKDIYNLLPAKSAVQSRSLAFLPRDDETHIRVDFNCAPRNYIIAARGHFDRNEIRDALSKSRQALESLTKDKIWRYVHRHGDGNLSLKLRSPAAPIELRNISEQLKAKIGKGDFGDQNKNLVYDPIDTLLGLNGDSREWRYLNKGTHEENDRAEFDRSSVSIIISALESLDQAL
ncbi:MAG: AAA family ATPase [Gammaproteobacteria bacterium]|nr:AAA family ATPase [Gammaproteobacteria bacterium]